MGVGIQREGGVGVAQNPRQGFGIYAAGEGVGGEGMTQIMKADAGQPCPLEERLHVAIGRIGIDGIFRLHRVREYPLADGIRLAPPQDFSYAVRQDDGAHALIGLCLTDGILALPLAVESAAHLQRTGIPIEVAPLQTADLAAAQAGHQLRLEEVPPHLVLLHHCKEVVQLRTGQDALGLVVGLGRRCPLGGVPGNDMRLHRVLQRGVEGGMDVAHHGVGELMIHLGVFVDAPLRFQTAVHPLDVLLGEEGDLLVAQLQLDVVFDVAAVALEGTGPHRTRLVLREPAIQPLAQRHAAVLGQLHIAVALDVLVELVQQRLLRLGVDMTEQRFAIFLVADDDAALPASVVTPSHHAVTGRSSFCHVFHFLWIHFLFCNTNNYHTFAEIAIRTLKWFVITSA